MTRTVLVIGAGITGVSIAETLRRDGWNVTLIDRVDPGDPTQASYGNGGVIARSGVVPVSVPGLLAKAPLMLLDPSSPLFLRWSYLPRLLPWLVPFLRSGQIDRVKKIVGSLASLTYDAVDQHRSLAEGTGAERYIQTGSYSYIYRSREALQKGSFALALRREHGFDYEEIDRPALLDRDPNLGEDYRFAAVFPDHGWISSPGNYVAALARHFRQAGGRIQKGEVVDIRPGQPASVTLQGGERLEAEKVVLAAGIWSRALARKLGQKINMESERGYHLILKNPSFSPPSPYMVADAKIVVTPMDGEIRLAGTVEFGGLDAPPSKAPLNLMRKQIRAVYPELTWQGEETWMGHRPSTTDSLPVIGEAPGAQGVVYAFGSQHIGLTIGPRIGRIVADILQARRSNIDLEPFAAARFGPPRIKSGASSHAAGSVTTVLDSRLSKRERV